MGTGFLWLTASSLPWSLSQGKKLAYLVKCDLALVSWGHDYAAVVPKAGAVCQTEDSGSQGPLLQGGNQPAPVGLGNDFLKELDWIQVLAK